MNDSTKTMRTFALAVLVLVLTFLAANRESPALQDTTTAQTVAEEALVPTPPTPRMAGVLLIELPATESAAAEKRTLPDAASDLPLIVLLGALSIAGWVVLRCIHSKRNY